MAVIREICSHVAIIELGSLVEKGEVADIFNHPKSQAARELISRDRPQSAWTDMEGWDGEKRQLDRLNERKRIRIVFSENSAFEPVIGNMVLKFGTPVNILRADTKNVGGVAKGEMILGLPDDAEVQKAMEEYLLEKGLEIEEVAQDVEQ
jgi:D-methionine transport system ATP-binding protein